MAAVAIPIAASIIPAAIPLVAKLGPSFLKNLTKLGKPIQQQFTKLLNSPEATEKISNIVSNLSQSQSQSQSPSQAQPQAQTQNLTDQQIASLISTILVHAPELVTKKPAQTAGGGGVSFECLRAFFVDSVQNSQLFLSLMKNDEFHCELLFSENDRDFLHFIYYVYDTTRNYLYQTGYKSCGLCGVNFTESSFNQLTIFVYKHREGIAHFFNTWFNTDLARTLQLFEGMKPICSPFDGTYGWDLNLIMLNNLKKSNHIRSAHYVQYHGILYKYETFTSVAFKAISIVKSYFNNGITNFALIYSVKKVFQPEHWCGIFIDFNNNNYYFYNSLAREDQINKLLFNMINYLLEKINMPRLTFITNENRQQEDSKLCGMYVYHFIKTMSEENPANRLNLFNKHFNDSAVLTDQILPNLLPKYITMPNQTKSTDSMMHYFFSLFEPLVNANK